MKNDPEPKIIEKEIYRHTRTGNLYQVLGVALHSETLEQLVIYKPLYDSKYELFARPYDMFVEEVELGGAMKPRFEKVED